MDYFRKKLNKAKSRHADLTASEKLKRDLPIDDTRHALKFVGDIHSLHNIDQPDIAQTFINDRHGVSELDLKLKKIEEDALPDRSKSYSNGMAKDQQSDYKEIKDRVRNKLDKIKSVVLAHLKDNIITPESSELVDLYKPSFYTAKKKGEIKHGVSFKKNGRLYQKLVEEEYNKNPEKFHPVFSTTNSKLNNEAIASWSIPHRTFCPGAGPICKGCYVDSGPMGWHEAAVRRWMNNYASKNDDFVDKAVAAINGIAQNQPVSDVKDFSRLLERKPVTKEDGKQSKPINHYARRVDENGNPVTYNWDHIRWHDAGDFHSAEYIRKIAEIIKRTPEMFHYWYTKSFHVPELREAMAELEALPNVKSIQSLGSSGDQYADPNKPTALVHESEDQIRDPGWVSAYNSDRIAADPNNPRIALAAHAGLGKEGSFDLHDHVKNAKAYHELIALALAHSKSRKTKKKQAKAKKKIKKSEDLLKNEYYHIKQNGYRVTDTPVHIDHINKKWGGVKKLESNGFRLIPAEPPKIKKTEKTLRSLIGKVKEEPMKKSEELNKVQTTLRSLLGGRRKGVRGLVSKLRSKVPMPPMRKDEDENIEDTKELPCKKDKVDKCGDMIEAKMKENIAKGDLVSLKDAKMRSDADQLPKTDAPKKSPFTQGQIDRSKQKIQAALDQQGKQGSPYAQPRGKPKNMGETPEPETKEQVANRFNTMDWEGKMARLDQSAEKLKGAMDNDKKRSHLKVVKNEKVIELLKRLETSLEKLKKSTARRPELPHPDHIAQTLDGEKHGSDTKNLLERYRLKYHEIEGKKKKKIEKTSKPEDESLIDEVFTQEDQELGNKKKTTPKVTKDEITPKMTKPVTDEGGDVSSKVAPPKLSGSNKAATHDEFVNAFAEKYPDMTIPNHHEQNKTKMSSYINKLNQTPGRRGEAFRLYGRFISGDGYSKNETLSKLIKAEIEEWDGKKNEK